jgi:hypothetical protein
LIGGSYIMGSQWQLQIIQLERTAGYKISGYYKKQRPRFQWLDCVPCSYLRNFNLQGWVLYDSWCCESSRNLSVFTPNHANWTVLRSTEKHSKAQPLYQLQLLEPNTQAFAMGSRLVCLRI